MTRRHRLSLVLSIAMCLLPTASSAITDADSHAITFDTTYYDPNDGCGGATAAGAVTVVLDPGHSGGPDFTKTDEVDGPATGSFSAVNIAGSGVVTEDNGGAPGELTTMWTAANMIDKTLTAAGYNVILTKTAANDNVGLLQRAKIANDAKAAIAVSLHYTGGAAFGSQSPHWGVTPQAVGESRTNQTGGASHTFTDAAVATASQGFAKTIQQERSKAGDPVSDSPLDASFLPSRGLLSYGNISIVQLFSKVPWVYNEDGADGFDINKYTTGIANGIMKAVPIPKGLTSATPTGLPTLTGKDNIAQAMNFLMSSLGLTAPQAAGMVGNMMWESGGGVALVPNADELKGKATTPTNADGFGLSQWTFTDRQAPLVALANKFGVQPDNLAVQLLYIEQELKGAWAPALAAVKKTTNVADATTQFMDLYEVPAPATANYAARLKGAQQALTGSGATGAGSPSGSTGTCAAVSGSNNSIAAQAIMLAWPKPDCTQSFKDAQGTTETRGSCLDSTNAYKKAWDGASDQTDCGAFVASSVISSGADKNYPKAGTIVQYAYVKSHPSLYQIINTQSTAGLQPGDIMVASNEADGTGHTALYVGNVPGDPAGGFVAAASWHGHTPQMDGSNSNGEVVFILAQGAPYGAAAARFK